MPVAAAQGRSAPSARELTARIDAAYGALKAGKSDSNRERLRAALRAAADSDHFVLTINAYLNAAQSFLRARDAATATALLEEALKTRAAQRDGRDAAMLWFNTANFMSNTDQNARGIPIAVEARRRMMGEFGPRSYDAIASGDLLASLLVNNGAVASGLNLSELIHDDAQAALGADEPLTWRTANNFAEALRMVGHPDVAKGIDEPLLRKRIAHYGLGSIQALTSASNLALDYLAMGDEAATMQALDMQKRAGAALADPHSEHVAQAQVWIDYARAYFHPDRRLDRDALEAMVRVKDWNGAPDLLQIKASQLSADQLEKRGDSDRALALRIDAYDRARRSFSPAHPLTFEALLGVATARMRRGDADTLATFTDLEQQVFRWMLRGVGTAGNRFVAETTRKLADDILFEFGNYAFAEPAAAIAYADAVSRWKTMENGERTQLRLAADRMPDAATGALARTVLRLSAQQQELLSSGKIDDDARVVLQELQRVRETLALRRGEAAMPSQSSIEDQLKPADALVDFCQRSS